MSKRGGIGPRCYWCHDATAPLTRDHVVPLGFGGPKDDRNVVPACGPCNAARGRITSAALAIWQQRSAPDKTRCKLAKNWAELAPLIAEWAVIEKRRRGRKGSVSDKLGTAALPFPAEPCGGAAAPPLSRRKVLKAARERAEQQAQGEAA